MHKGHLCTLSSGRHACEHAVLLVLFALWFPKRKKGAFPAARPAGSDLVTLAESHFWRASFLWDKFMMLCKPVIMLRWPSFVRLNFCWLLGENSCCFSETVSPFSLSSLIIVLSTQCSIQKVVNWTEVTVLTSWNENGPKVHSAEKPSCPNQQERLCSSSHLLTRAPHLSPHHRITSSLRGSGLSSRGKA